MFGFRGFLYMIFTLSISVRKVVSEWEERGSFTHGKHRHFISIEDVPHHVLVAYDNVFCSGSLIYSNIVVTVASCFIPGKNDRCFVKVGTSSVPGFGDVIPVVERKMHEYYNYEVPLNNDIALLKLERSVTFSPSVKKAILVEPDVTIRVDTTLNVIGWGSKSMGAKLMNRLLLTEMKVVTEDECSEIYGELNTHAKYCARYEPERRLSDNGGSAMFKDLLVGIVSYGATHTEEEMCVALLTNVSYFHRWIILNSERLLKKYCVEGQSDYD